MSHPASTTDLDSQAGVANAASATLDANRTPLLKLENISKIFGGVKALRAVKFDIMPGEVLCLAGENGAVDAGHAITPDRPRATA